MTAPSAEVHLRRVTVVYILAQVLLAAAIVSGWALAEALQQQFDTSAQLGQLAGEQRALAEAAVDLANTASSPSLDRSAAAPGNFQRAVGRWRAGQRSLLAAASTQRDSPLQLLDRHDNAAMVLSSGQALDDAFRRLERADLTGEGRSAQLDSLYSARTWYVQELTAMADGVGVNHESLPRGLGWVLGGAVAGALALVVGKTVFVFRPLIRRLSATYGALQSANEELSAELARRLASERERDALASLLPICSGCKRIRDSHGEWESIEAYLEERSEVRFSHGLCADCVRRLYPELADRILARPDKNERNSRGSIPS